ncbi:MAG: hypothetical protein ACSLE1_01340 [Sphingobium sp.]
MIKRSSILKIGSIASIASLLLASPAMATAKSSEQAGARIGNNVGLRTGATSVNGQRSKAVGASLGLILLAAAAVGTAVVVVATDDDDEPASPGS